MTETAVLLEVRTLLRRIEDRLENVDADAPIAHAPAADTRLTTIGSLVRAAADLLDASTPAMRAAPFAVGTRFFSEGLRAPCRVLSIEGDRLEFTSESLVDANIRTDVPLDLARRHLAAGRWRLLESGA
jgi:hypothetical protein